MWIPNPDELVAWMNRLDQLGEHELGEVLELPAGQLLRYRDMTVDGQSHKFALMLATKSFPGIRSDSIFNEGKFSGSVDPGTNAREAYFRKTAEASGISTNGRWYCGGLADRRGHLDPEAWIDSVSDVKRVCEKRNLTILDGYVSHEGHEVAPTPDIPIDPSLVRREALEVMATNPGSRYEDVYERVKDLRTGKADTYVPLVKDVPDDFEF